MTNNLQKIYELRFTGLKKYRNSVWKILVDNFFKRWIPKNSTILDLGCGYGEFINNVSSKEKYAMDLNPESQFHLAENIKFHEQDCSKAWPIKPNSIDVIFTSNFFEHLPNKKTLNLTIENAMLALKSGGVLMALGPNISVLNGKYWDFWDHHTPLSNLSLTELLEIHGFKIIQQIPRFLPYNMVRVKKRPLFLVTLYLRLPFLWYFWGKQFFIVATKT